MEENVIFKYIRLKIWLMLLFALPSVSAENGSAWQIFQQAVQMANVHGAADKIIDLCEQVQKQSNDPVLQTRAVFLTVEMYSKKNDLVKAGKLLQEIYQSAAQPATARAEARLRHALIFSRNRQFERALSLFRITCDSAANEIYSHEALLGQANALANLGRWNESDSLIKKLIESAPNYRDDERVRILTARQALSLGNPQIAIEQLADKKSKIALKILAQAYEKAGKSIMAVGVYKKIRDIYSGSKEAEEALYQAGEVFMRAGDWLAARTEYSKLLENYPASSRKQAVQFRLGWINLQLKQYDKALAAFDVQPVEPGAASYFAFMRAQCLQQMGLSSDEKLHEAILAFNSVAALYGKSPVAPLAKLRAAMILLELGETTDAVISLRQFLSLYPKDELSATTTFLLATRGKAGMSQYYFNQIIEHYQNHPLFDAAFTALQMQDYREANYQKMINRQAHLGIAGKGSHQLFWQRAQALLHGEASYYLQHFDQAISDFNSAIGTSDDLIAKNANLGIAWCVLRQGYTDSARTHFAELQKKFTGVAFAKASYGLATCYYQQKNFEKALQTYPADLQDAGNTELKALIAKSLFRSGACYFRLEYYGQAIEIWQQLARNYPQHELAPQALYRAADTYFRANHFDKAEETYAQILQSYSNSKYAVESMLQLAQCKYNSAEYQAAVAGFQQFIEKYPQHAKSKDALEGIQLSYYQLGQTEQASGALEKVIEQFPDGLLSADARFRLAQSYLDSKNFTKAITAFKEILTQFPGTSYSMDAQFALAGAYQANGENELANGEYQRFIQYFPDSPNVAEATFNLAVGYFNLESYLSASDYFNQLIEQHEESSFYLPALQNLGWCYKKLGENEKALQYFQAFVDKNAAGPEQDQMRLQIASINSELGNEKKAMPVFLSLSNSKNSEIAAEAAYQRGMLLLKGRKVDAAGKSFKIAIQKGEGDNFYRLSALAQLGAIYEGKKDWKRAVAAYKLLADSTSDPTWAAAAQERMQAIVSMTSTE